MSVKYKYETCSEGSAVCQNVRDEEIADRIIAEIPDRLPIDYHQFTPGPRGQGSLLLDFSGYLRYDGYKNNVKRILQDAAKRAGTTGTFEVTDIVVSNTGMRRAHHKDHVVEEFLPHLRSSRPGVPSRPENKDPFA